LGKLGIAECAQLISFWRQFKHLGSIGLDEIQLGSMRPTSVARIEPMRNPRISLGINGLAHFATLNPAYASQ
jgi:hypothetical protein